MYINVSETFFTVIPTSLLNNYCSIDHFRKLFSVFNDLSQYTNFATSCFRFYSILLSFLKMFLEVISTSYIIFPKFFPCKNLVLLSFIILLSATYTSIIPTYTFFSNSQKLLSFVIFI